MISLEKGEGNLITLEFLQRNTDVEVLVSRFTEEFEKWGRIERKSLIVPFQGKVLKLEIHDADPETKSDYTNWIEEFQNLSAEFGYNFTVTWVPYINAFEDAKRYTIEPDYMVKPSTLVWTGWF